MRALLISIVVCAALALLGCEKKVPPPSTDKPAAAKSDKLPTAVKPSAPEEKIPVASDFEAQAVKEISAENYEQELDKLAQELSSD